MPHLHCALLLGACLPPSTLLTKDPWAHGPPEGDLEGGSGSADGPLPENPGFGTANFLLGSKTVARQLAQRAAPGRFTLVSFLLEMQAGMLRGGMQSLQSKLSSVGNQGRE